MKKKFKYRILTIMLSAIMLCSVFAGCGNDVQQDIEQTTETSVDSTDINSDEYLEEAKKAEEEAAKKAEEEAKKAEEAKRIEAEAKKAEEEAIKAEEAAKKAEEEAKAEEERIKAEAEAKKAEEERLKAEEERLKAEAEAKKAEEERLKAEAEAKKAEQERILTEQAKDNELTPTQLTSINMLNYMTVLTQKINASRKSDEKNNKGNQIYLEAARTILYNEINLNAVDTNTQAQIIKMVGIIDQYRMVDVKRERLQFIYEQNKAQALKSAIPNPLGLLSAVSSGNMLKAAASVVYMAVDSASSYASARNQAELQFIKEGWELDDTELKVLQDSTTAQFDYMCNMVRKFDLPDEYVVRDTDVKDFVEWSNDTNLVGKIEWLKTNEKTYQKFGPYWLELVKDYYEAGEYKNCLSAIKQYEEITAKITRKDIDYATALPMVILAARETMNQEEYVKTAIKYCEAIEANTKDEDWALRYFAAQIYIDIYGKTNKRPYLAKAYDIAFNNVNVLKKEQRALNAQYLAPIVDVEPEKDATKRAKKEIKQYNKLLKDERKVALPPVSDALYLNCDLLFAIADERDLLPGEREKIEKMLHENGEDLFLTKPIDLKFRYKDDISSINTSNITVSFDGSELEIPVAYVSDRANVTVTVSGSATDVLDDWEIKEVERPKNSSYQNYTVKFESKKGKDHKYQTGERITITVMPIVDSPDETLTFSYEVVPVKKAKVFDGTAFERK